MRRTMKKTVGFRRLGLITMTVFNRTDGWSDGSLNLTEKGEM